MADSSRVRWLSIGLAVLIAGCGESQSDAVGANTLQLTIEPKSQLTIFTSHGSLVKDENGNWTVLSISKGIFNKSAAITITEAQTIESLCRTIAETTTYGNIGEGGEGFDLVAITYGKYTTVTVHIGAKNGNFPEDVKQLRALVISQVER